MWKSSKWPESFCEALDAKYLLKPTDQEPVSGKQDFFQLPGISMQVKDKLQHFSGW